MTRGSAEATDDARPPGHPHNATRANSPPKPRRRLYGPYAPIPLAVLRATNVTPSAKLVYAAMLSYQGKRDSCTATIARIASRAGISERTTQRSIQELETCHFISPTAAPEGKTKAKAWIVRSQGTW